MRVFEWIIRWGPNTIYAFLALGLLVFIHELGHFLAAKWCGIRVEKFSIGFRDNCLCRWIVLAFFLLASSQKPKKEENKDNLNEFQLLDL